MHKFKYPSIFSCQVEAILFILLQIFFAANAVLKIGEYYQMFPSFSWEIFGHVTRLDHSRESENIWSIMIVLIFVCPVLFFHLDNLRSGWKLFSDVGWSLNWQKIFLSAINNIGTSHYLGWGRV